MIDNPAHQRIAELESTNQFTQKSISELLGLHLRSVEQILARPEVKAEVERLREVGVIDLESMVAVRRALLATKADGTTPDHTVRLAAAKALADMPRSLPATETATGPLILQVHLNSEGQIVDAGCPKCGYSAEYEEPPTAPAPCTAHEDGSQRILSSRAPHGNRTA